MARIERTQLTSAEQHAKDRIDTDGLKAFKAKQREMGKKRPANWDYARKIVVIVATMFLAAGRTALTLFIESRSAATLLTTFGLSGSMVNSYALGMAFLSLLAIEGYIVNTGIDRGKRLGEMDEHGKRITSAIPAKYALTIAVTISVLAGIGVSIAPVAWLDAIGGEAIRVILGLVVGAGVSVMAYAAGEDLGWAMRRDKLLDDAWEKEMKRRWLVSSDRRKLLYNYLYIDVQDEPAPISAPAPQVQSDPLAEKGVTQRLIVWFTETYPGKEVTPENIVEAAYRAADFIPSRDQRNMSLQRMRTALFREREKANGKSDNGHSNN